MPTTKWEGVGPHQNSGDRAKLGKGLKLGVPKLHAPVYV